MKVLLIASQIIDIKNDKCYADGNFHSIVKSFSALGDLTICSRKYKSDSSLKLSEHLDFVEKYNVKQLNKARVIPNMKDLAVVKEEVKKADLIIGYNPSLYGELAYYYAKKYNKKYMTYLVACVWDSLWNHSIKVKVIAPFLFIRTKYIVKNSDYVLYISRQFLQKRYPTNGMQLGCSDVAIDNCSNEVLVSRLKNISKKGLDREIKLCTIGAVHVKYKGQHFVIEALSHLKKQGIDNYHYYLVGGGNNKYLKSVAKKFNVEANVHFVGTLPHSEIFSFIDSIDIYIQPSIAEALGRVIIEAMSRGVLCIGARTGGIPELLDDNYIVEQRSVDDIVNILKKITVDDMILQAKRNFAEALKYEKEPLSTRRNNFFNTVIKDQ